MSSCTLVHATNVEWKKKKATFCGHQSSHSSPFIDQKWEKWLTKNKMYYKGNRRKQRLFFFLRVNIVKFLKALYANYMFTHFQSWDYLPIRCLFQKLFSWNRLTCYEEYSEEELEAWESQNDTSIRRKWSSCHRALEMQMKTGVINVSLANTCRGKHFGELCWNEGEGAGRILFSLSGQWKCRETRTFWLIWYFLWIPLRIDVPSQLIIFPLTA